jgi:hypothetical protein
MPNRNKVHDEFMKGIDLGNVCNSKHIKHTDESSNNKNEMLKLWTNIFSKYFKTMFDKVYTYYTRSIQHTVAKEKNLIHIL